jgi:hypothetical protein
MSKSKNTSKSFKSSLNENRSVKSPMKERGVKYNFDFKRSNVKMVLEHIKEDEIEDYAVDSATY